MHALRKSSWYDKKNPDNQSDRRGIFYCREALLFNELVGLNLIGVVVYVEGRSGEVF